MRLHLCPLWCSIWGQDTMYHICYITYMLHYNATCDYISALDGAPSEGIRTRNAAPPAVEEVEENGRKLPEVRMPKYNTIHKYNTMHSACSIQETSQIQYNTKHRCNTIDFTKTKFNFTKNVKYHKHKTRQEGMKEEYKSQLALRSPWVAQ